VGRCVADQIMGLATPELVGLSPERMNDFSREQVDAFVNVAL